MLFCLSTLTNFAHNTSPFASSCGAAFLQQGVFLRKRNMHGGNSLLVMQILFLDLRSKV